jgi:hypothetical protein
LIIYATSTLPVNKFYVAINLLRREDPHTPPTNMSRALRTSHMVATPVLLDQDLHCGHFLILVALRPTVRTSLSSQVQIYLPLLAAEPIVLLLTGNANRHEARSAPEDPISRIGFGRVDFGAVGGGAVFELVGIVAKVFEEGDFQQVLELSGKEELLYDGERDRNTTLPLIAHARQGELLGIGGGEEEVMKAPITINVAASEAVRLVDRVVTNSGRFLRP